MLSPAQRLAANVWAEGKGPLYQRLVRAISQAIERGDIAPNSRLPAERELAEALAISRSTVVAAYDQLADGGVVERRQGSGTYVRAAAAPSQVAPEALADALGANSMFRGLIAGPSEIIDFSMAAPLPAPGVMEVLRRMPEMLPSAEQLGRGYWPAGLPALRRSVAQHFTAMGLPTNEQQVLVTNGGQQAINLAAQLWLTPGDGVAVENPTYHGALDAFRATRARILSIPVDDEGVRTDRIRELLSRTAPRVVYVSPTFNNPTGVLLSRRRREELAVLAHEFQVPVIEDLVDQVPLTGDPVPPPVALDGNGWIATIGSMSKVFWGGLRVGWIRASERTIFRLAQLKAVADLGTSVVSQMACVELLRRDAGIRAARLAEARESLRQLEGGLTDHLPDWQWEQPTGGYHLWVKLPQGNAADFLQVAGRFGVSAAPGPLFSADGGFGDYMRLTFLLDRRDMDEGIRRLALAWQAYLPRSADPGHALSAIV